MDLRKLPSILFTIFTIFTIFILGGCTTGNEQQQEITSDKIKTGSTIFPIHAIVNEVGGENIDSVLILPPGSSPHTYEATPNQVKEIQNTDIFFRVGGEVDQWISNISNTVPEAQTVSLNEFIELKLFGLQATNGHDDEHENGNIDNEHEDEYHEHDDGRYDPHTWLDPDRAGKMAEIVAQELGGIDEGNQNYYQDNAQAFINNLKAKDENWQNKLAELDNKNIIVFHDAWGYFSQHFGLNIVASFEPFPGKSPTSQYIAELEEEIKKNNVSTIFVEPQLSQESVNALASDLDIQVAVLDPIGGLEERNSYINMIDYNIENIYQALK